MARARRYALATRVRLEVYTVEAGTVMRDLHLPPVPRQIDHEATDEKKGGSAGAYGMSAEDAEVRPLSPSPLPKPA